MTTPSPDARKRFVGTITELFLDVRVILALTIATLAVVFGMGASALAEVDARADKAAKAAVGPEVEMMKHRLDAQDKAVRVVHDRLDNIQAEQKDARAEQRAIREDIRLFANGRALPPLPPLDGGTP